MWMMLLEKAYAKVHGSYERIVGGWSHFAARDLTGAISYQYDIEDKNDNQFEILKEAVDQGHFAMCSVKSKYDADFEEFFALGLRIDHAYSVINAAVVEKDGE